MARKKTTLPTRFRLLQLLSMRTELTGSEALNIDPTIPPGTIYTTLHRLEREKMVTSRQDTEKGLSGVPRRFYRITKRGRRYLQLGINLAQILQSTA